MRILVVEDDVHVADVLRRGLVEQRYTVDVAHDGIEGADLALANEYDLIILDLMLPGMDGKAVCRKIRSEGLTVPILMLTALGWAGDVIAGLDQGADDYLTKPYDFGILMARVRSLTRRTTELRTAEICIGELTIDVAQRSVTRDNVQISLTAKEFTLLEYLAMNRGRVLSRDSIAEHVWDMHFDPRSNVIESLIRFLRNKIDGDRPESLIRTVRGIGYRMDG